jgi:hypothetical protein
VDWTHKVKSSENAWDRRRADAQAASHDSLIGN